MAPTKPSIKLDHPDLERPDFPRPTYLDRAGPIYLECNGGHCTGTFLATFSCMFPRHQKIPGRSVDRIVGYDVQVIRVFPVEGLPNGLAIDSDKIEEATPLLIELKEKIQKLKSELQEENRYKKMYEEVCRTVGEQVLRGGPMMSGPYFRR